MLALGVLTLGAVVLASGLDRAAAREGEARGDDDDDAVVVVVGNEPTRSAYLRVFKECSQADDAGLIWATMRVRHNPGGPTNESFNSRVNFDPRKGTCRCVAEATSPLLTETAEFEAKNDECGDVTAASFTVVVCFQWALEGVDLVSP